MRHLPGDRRPVESVDTSAMIRVNQAGEYGAARIYAGQLAVMGRRSRMASEIAHMAAQEQRHLDGFDKLMTERRVRPTVFAPLWHVAGYALGAVTALIGPKAAMAATVAVETVIDEHYGAQEAALADGSDPVLLDMVTDYRGDEAEHRETAAGHAGENGFPVMQSIIRAGCRIAIRVAERV
jgi:ubiquinone biosynthesis monooxygenase Coq7